jgi:hypothetical protein
VCWKPRSSSWSFHLLQEEFLSAPIHSPLSDSSYRSFTVDLFGQYDAFEIGSITTDDFTNADKHVVMLAGVFT